MFLYCHPKLITSFKVQGSFCFPQYQQIKYIISFFAGQHTCGLYTSLETVHAKKTAKMDNMLFSVYMYQCQVLQLGYKSRRFNFQYSCKVCGTIRLIYETIPYTQLSNSLQGAVAQYAANQIRNTKSNPFSFQVHQILLRPIQSSQHHGEVARLGLEPTLC